MAESPTSKVTDAELAIAYRGPAVLVNRFYASCSSAGVRIAFAEQSTTDASPIFRNAVAMSVKDGVTLYKLLQTLLKDIEPQLDKIEQAFKEPEEDKSDD